MKHCASNDPQELLKSAQRTYWALIEDWPDLPHYVRSKAYFEALMTYVGEQIAEGRTDIRGIVARIIGQEGKMTEPPFPFPRNRI